MAQVIYRSQSVELTEMPSSEPVNPLHAPLQETQESSEVTEAEFTVRENESSAYKLNHDMTLFPLFEVNAWFNHGWIYYFYFTGYSTLIKTVAVLLFSALIKETLYLLLDTTSKFAVLFDLLLPYAYGHALIISMCIPIFLTYNYHKKQLEWSESQFSFLIKNLPRDMSPDELKTKLTNSLNTLFKEKDIAGKVKEIILLQDCKELMEMETEIKSIKNNLKRLEMKNKLPDSKTLVRLSYCQTKFAMLNDEARNFRLFKGRAILILDSIWAKKQIKRVIRGRFFLWPTFKVPMWDRVLRVSEIYEPSEMRYNFLNERFWPKFFLILFFQVLLLSGNYISLLFRVDLLESVPNTGDPWESIQNMVQVTAMVIYSSVSFILLMLLQNYIPYASKTTKYRMSIVYGVLQPNLTISSVYQSYLEQQGLEWTLSKVIYGMFLFLVTNTGVRLLGYTYVINRAKKAVSEEEKKIEFDFWPSFSNIYQFMVLGIYYMALRPVVIFSSTIVLTIVILVIDKWYILKHCNTQTKLQSFETGFILYLVIPINLIIRYFDITYLIQIQDLQNDSLEYNNSIDADFYTDVSAFLDYFSDACVVFWAVLLTLGGYMLIRDVFNQVNAENKVPYDSVSDFFKSFYAKEIPFYDLQLSKSSTSSSIENQIL